ncbi:MAG: AsmA family protein [Alphaproteobacteria bacterium]|nr:AsmA family protein [Alphaproteobacteria bacterium]MDP6622203.1 AsmA family protein [Alphaproteobacteria bacterium]
MKKILFGGLALLVVAVAALLIAPGFIDWNAYKSEIAERAQAATGRRLDIKGDLSLTLLPAPALSVEGLALESIAGAQEPTMVALQSAEARVALWPLLRGEVQVDEVRLVKPVITLERLADGRANWQLGPRQQADGGTGVGAGSEVGGSSTDFRLDRLLIEDGTLVFHDAASGVTERLEGIDAKLSAGSLAGPFSARGGLSARGLKLAFDAQIGILKPAQALPLKLALEVAGAKTKMTLSGSLSQPDANATLTAKLDLAGPDLAQLTRLAHQAAGIAPPPLTLNQPFSLKTALSASSTELALNDIQFNLGNSTVSGGANMSFAETLGFDVALNANRFDLDALLAGIAAGGDGTSKAAKNTKEANAEAGADAGAFAIPANLAGNLNLGIEALSYRGSIIRQAQLEASVAKGVVTLDRAAVLLPGGSDAQLSGRLSTVKGQPQFEGTLEATSDNLRALMDWLAVEVGPVPNDRLRKFTLLTRLRATPALIEIYGLDSRLDTTRLSGAVAYALRARPSFGADFSIDRLNLDAYLPAAPASEADAAKADAKGKSADTDSGASPLALLEKFDTDIKLKLGHLTYNKVAARGIALDVGLLGGNLKVRRATVKDLAGAAFQLSGSARDLARKITAQGKVKVTAKNPSGLFRLAGLNLPFPAERLGKFALDGSIGGAAGRLDLDLKLQAGRNRLGAKGWLADPITDPKVELVLNLANPSHSNLMRLFDPAFQPAGKGLDGAIDLRGKLAGSLDGLKLDFTAGLAKARLEAKGTVQPLKAGYQLALLAKADDALRFLRRLGVDYRPAAKPFGGLALAFNLAGDAGALQIANLKGGFGPIRLEGTAAARLTGNKPFISADLKTSEILVDLFLPPQASANKSGRGAKSGGGGKDAAPRWSTDAIEVGFLNTFDADLQLAAPGIGYGAYHFAKPRVKAVIKDGVLDIKPLTGQLFDGSVALSARLDGRSTPATSLTIDLKNGNLKKALMQAAGIDVATGSFGLEGSFQARGRSQIEMIRSLGGQTSFAAQEGVVSGFDLKALSDRLKELDRGGDFLRLIQTSMRGGQTRFSRVGGTAKIEKGVARSDDIRADLEAGKGTGQGSVDLPRWLIDFFGEFRLSEHPKAPPVGLILRGPLDAPQRDIKSRKLEAYVSRRVGGTLLRKFGGSKLGDKLGGALGGSRQAPAQQQPQSQSQPQSQPAQKLKPEDLIKGLFKSLKR